MGGEILPPKGDKLRQCLGKQTLKVRQIATSLGP